MHDCPLGQNPVIGHNSVCTSDDQLHGVPPGKAGLNTDRVRTRVPTSEQSWAFVIQISGHPDQSDHWEY